MKAMFPFQKFEERRNNSHLAWYDSCFNRGT